jgi:hypothetical protein
MECVARITLMPGPHACALGPDHINWHVPLMSLIKSKQRVADHGEVFTSAWMVEAMLDLVKDEANRICQVL